MSRSTQFVGLSDSAEKWIQKYCIHNTVSTTTITADESGKVMSKSVNITRTPCTKLIKGGKVLGMFGEVVHELKSYTTKTGYEVIEFIQADPWSSGPVIFLALKFLKTGDVVVKSLHSKSVIDNC